MTTRADHRGRVHAASWRNVVGRATRQHLQPYARKFGKTAQSWLFILWRKGIVPEAPSASPFLNDVSTSPMSWFGGSTLRGQRWRGFSHLLNHNGHFPLHFGACDQICGSQHHDPSLIALSKRRTPSLVELAHLGALKVLTADGLSVSK